MDPREVRIIQDKIVMPYEGDVQPLRRVIPNKVFTEPTSGRKFIAMPHTLDTARVMANMGVPPIPPIATDQKRWFTGRYKPFLHQVETAAFCTMHRRAYVLSSMGVGKTASCIWAAEYLRKVENMGSVLVVAPLSCLVDVWQRELFAVAPQASVCILHGSAVTRKLLLKKQYDYYIINHDGIKFVQWELVANKWINHIILDEASAFKNPSTDRWKAMNIIANGRTIWAVTGTPSAQSPMDAYGIIKLTTPDVLPAGLTRTRWEAMTMQKVRRFKSVPKPGAMDTVYKFMRPGIRYTKDQCLDLPGVLYSNRAVQRTKKQTDMIRKLTREWVVADKDTTITAVNAASRMSKILQISQGVVIAEDGSRQIVPPTPRLKVMCDIIAQSSSKTVVFAPYKGVLALIEKVLEEVGVQAVRIDGSVSKTRRDARIKRFREDNSVRVLIAHPAVAAHGLTLVEASTIVWFGPEHSVERYEQANARTDRPGQKHKTQIIHLVADDIERNIVSAVRGKAGMQAKLLSLYEGLVGAGKP